eukprot:8983098-Karenia_brevis.AAC.1
MMGWPKCSSIELVPTSLELFETVYKEYTERAGTILGKGFRVAVIKGMLPDAIRKTVDTSPVDMQEEDIKAYIK